MVAVLVQPNRAQLEAALVLAVDRTHVLIETAFDIRFSDYPTVVDHANLFTYLEWAQDTGVLTAAEQQNWRRSLNIRNELLARDHDIEYTIECLQRHLNRIRDINMTVRERLEGMEDLERKLRVVE